MTSRDVIKLYVQLEGLGIQIWIDGGWAVDALLGRETRSHKDIDIAIEQKNLLRLREYLESRGYQEIERDKDKKWDLVLGDNKGHEIDVHTFVLDKDGLIVKEEYWDGYSSNSLSGTGIINGHSVRCVSLSQLIKTHTGGKRELKEKDYKDMIALCIKFGIEIPKEYTQKPSI